MAEAKTEEGRGVPPKQNRYCPYTGHYCPFSHRQFENCLLCLLGLIADRLTILVNTRGL